MQKLVRIFCMATAFATFSFTMIGTSFASPWPSDTRVVRNDNGGRVIDYAIKMKRMERDQRTIRFEGPCDSACTLFLSLPASRACVTHRARFGFHLPYGSSRSDNRVAASFLLKSYPGWVRSWLQANGGLTNQLKVMPYEYARRYLGTCESAKQHRGVADARGHS